MDTKRKGIFDSLKGINYSNKQLSIFIIGLILSSMWWPLGFLLLAGVIGYNAFTESDDK